MSSVLTKIIMCVCMILCVYYQESLVREPRNEVHIIKKFTIVLFVNCVFIVSVVHES